MIYKFLFIVESAHESVEIFSDMDQSPNFFVSQSCRIVGL